MLISACPQFLDAALQTEAIALYLSAQALVWTLPSLLQSDRDRLA